MKVEIEFYTIIYTAFYSLLYLGTVFCIALWIAYNVYIVMNYTNNHNYI